MKSLNRVILISAGIASSMIALLHILVILIGEKAYRYFHGVGDVFADLIIAGSIWPIIITIIISAIFFIFALYAFSGSGIIIIFPKLWEMVIMIGVIYTIRGLINFPFYINVILQHDKIFEIRSIIFDSISILIGILYLLGSRFIRKIGNKRT